MNICLINNLFPPISSGSSYYTYDVARYLSKNNKVIVVTNEVKGEKEIDVISDNLKIYRIPKINLPKINLWLKFPDFNYSLIPSNFKRIKNILISEKIEIIHQCNNIFDLVFASAYFSKKLNIPLLCSLTTPIQHSNVFYNKILEIFDRCIIKELFSRYVYKYLALDKSVQPYITNRYKKQNKLIPFTANDIELFSKIKINYNLTNYRLISLGHVSELKDRIETIKAWKIVTTKYPDAEVLIIGGIFNKKSKDLIDKLGLNKNIKFTGRLEHKEIIHFIEQSDFGSMFLSNLPYKKGIGTANLELMASGLPVILDADDNSFGNKYPFVNGKHFVKAESREPEWLAKKFIELFENSKMRENIGKAGRDFVQNTLTWEKIIPEIETLYREAIESNK